MEALKKASDKPGTGQAPGYKANTLPAPEVHDFVFSKSLLMMVSTFIIIAAVAYFTGMTGITGHDPGTASPPAAANPGVKKIAEGYTPSAYPSNAVQEPTPISSIITKFSNPRLTLNGIVYGIGKPTAIIENKIIEEGGSIKGMKVVKIYSDKVEMLDQATGQPFVLRVD